MRLQELCKSCGTCFKFYRMFYFTCDRSFTTSFRLLGLDNTASGDDRAQPTNKLLLLHNRPGFTLSTNCCFMFVTCCNALMSFIGAGSIRWHLKMLQHYRASACVAQCLSVVCYSHIDCQAISLW